MKHLIRSLNAAKQEMEALKNNARNTHFKSDYATLDEVIRVAATALHKNGVELLESPQSELVEGKIFHFQQVDLFHIETGESFRSRIALTCKDPDNPQQVKSARTYSRRQLWESICGLSSVDDDGAAAAENNTQNATQGRTQGQAGYTMPPDIQKRIYDAIGAHGQACSAYLLSQQALQPGQKIKDLNQQWTDHILSDLNGFVSKAIEWSENQQEIN